MAFLRNNLTHDAKTRSRLSIESMPSDNKDNAFDGIRFRIPVGLTRRWLLKERPLELVLKEMSS